MSESLPCASVPFTTSPLVRHDATREMTRGIRRLHIVCSLLSRLVGSSNNNYDLSADSVVPRYVRVLSLNLRFRRPDGVFGMVTTKNADLIPRGNR